MALFVLGVLGFFKRPAKALARETWQLVTRTEADLPPLPSPFPRKKVFPSTRRVACVCLVRAEASSFPRRCEKVFSLQAMSSLSTLYLAYNSSDGNKLFLDLLVSSAIAGV